MADIAKITIVARNVHWAGSLHPLLYTPYLPLLRHEDHTRKVQSPRRNNISW